MESISIIPSYSNPFQVTNDSMIISMEGDAIGVKMKDIRVGTMALPPQNSAIYGP